MAYYQDWNFGSALGALRGTADVTPAVSLTTRYGEVVLDASNPTPIVTGLASISQVDVSLKGAAAPGLGTTTLTYDVVGGTINVYAWKPTSVSNPTLIASTGTETVGWEARGNA